MFDVPQKEQQTFLESLSEPQNDIERSFNQYRCQSFFWSKWKIPVFNIFSLIFFLPVLLILLVRSTFIKKGEEVDALTDLGSMTEVIPNELREKYVIDSEKWTVQGGLRLSDMGVVLNLFFTKLPHSYFALKVLLKVSQYSEIIFRYNPRAIITHAEFSFASSILTHYCEKKGVRHINVMHGEKMYHIYDAFFRFNECYVWNEYYKQLFSQLKADVTQFRISVPPSMKINVAEHKRLDAYADYKYYLAELKEGEFEGVVESMKHLKESGKSVKYRLHPRYLNELPILTKYVSKEEIEDPRKVSIIDSVSNCSFAVGSYSTVLAQAYMSGIHVVLDDMTYEYQYNKLSEYGYWLIAKNCTRLSTLQQ